MYLFYQSKMSFFSIILINNMKYCNFMGNFEKPKPAVILFIRQNLEDCLKGFRAGMLNIKYEN